MVTGSRGFKDKRLKGSDMNEDIGKTAHAGVVETVVLEKFNKVGKLTQRNTVKNGVPIKIEYFPEEG